MMTDYININYEPLFNAYDQQAIVKATVGEVSGKGHQVFVFGFPAFLPSTQEVPGMDVEPGHEAEVCIIKILPETNNVVVSARVADEKRASAAAEKFEVGEIVTAQIKSLTQYGAFASIGSVDGLIHITELSYQRVSNPSTVVSVGQEIPVKIIGISEDDKGRKKIELSYKQALPNPWEAITFKVGDIVEGVVDRIADYGVFFTVDGVQALIHKSELSWMAHSPDPHSIIGMGDTIKAKILSIDIAKKKIAASIKEITEDPWKTLSIEPGDVLDVQITNQTNFGFFVGVGNGVEGLVHNNDLGWTKQDRDAMKATLSVGDTIRVVLLEIDKEKHRLSFSIKHLTPQP